MDEAGAALALNFVRLTLDVGQVGHPIKLLTVLYPL
jgi:hypothetical protein